MGIFNTLIGNASKIDNEDLDDKVAEFLFEGEEVLNVFSYIRDMILFTNARIIFLDKQGLTGKKKEFVSIPYRSISRFSIETTGHFDDDAELKLWINGSVEPIIKEFSKDKNVYDIGKIIAKFSCL